MALIAFIVGCFGFALLLDERNVCCLIDFGLVLSLIWEVNWRILIYVWWLGLACFEDGLVSLFACGVFWGCLVVCCLFYGGCLMIVCVFVRLVFGYLFLRFVLLIWCFV